MCRSRPEATSGSRRDGAGSPRISSRFMYGNSSSILRSGTRIIRRTQASRANSKGEIVPNPGQTPFQSRATLHRPAGRFNSTHPCPAVRTRIGECRPDRLNSGPHQLATIAHWPNTINATNESIVSQQHVGESDQTRIGLAAPMKLGRHWLGAGVGRPNPVRPPLP
jgi:hypothetical protein